MPHSYLSLELAALCIVLTGAYWRRSKPAVLPLPPSPKADFLIGHLRSLPSSNEHKVYRRWSEELGSEFWLELMICNLLVRNIIQYGMGRSHFTLAVRRTMEESASNDARGATQRG